MNNTFHLAYLSEATSPMTEDEILKLLDTARANNGRLNVSGLLSYNSGHFLQLLEGEEKVVMSLFDKISKDSRHTNIKGVYEGLSEARLFEQWAMAYKHIDTYSLSLRSRIEDLVGTISRGEMLYNSKDVLILFNELR